MYSYSCPLVLLQRQLVCAQCRYNVWPVLSVGGATAQQALDTNPFFDLAVRCLHCSVQSVWHNVGQRSGLVVKDTPTAEVRIAPNIKSYRDIKHGWRFHLPALDHGCLEIWLFLRVIM